MSRVERVFQFSDVQPEQRRARQPPSGGAALSLEFDDALLARAKIVAPPAGWPSGERVCVVVCPLFLRVRL